MALGPGGSDVGTMGLESLEYCIWLAWTAKVSGPSEAGLRIAVSDDTTMRQFHYSYMKVSSNGAHRVSRSLEIGGND